MDRKSTLLVAACLIFSILGWLRPDVPGRVHADDAGKGDAKQPNGPARIALVDLAKVYNQSNDFMAAKSEVVEHAKRLESEAKGMIEEFQAREKELKQLEAESEAHKELVAMIKKQAAAINEFRKRAQLEIMAKEAEIVAQTYKIVREQVQRYAETNGIDLVLRFNEFDPEAKTKPDSKSIAQTVNASVLYQNQLEITDAIIEAVNHR